MGSSKTDDLKKAEEADARGWCSYLQSGWAVCEDTVQFAKYKTNKQKNKEEKPNVVGPHL